MMAVCRESNKAVTFSLSPPASVCVCTQMVVSAQEFAQQNVEIMTSLWDEYDKDGAMYTP